MQEKRKICLFAHYNSENKISNYVLHYISCIKDLGFTIFFISNSKTTPFYKSKLNKISPTIRYYERENKGNDFGAWQWILSSNLLPEETDQLLLTNDSVFGPFFSLETVVNKMTELNLDFWGLTESRQGGWHLQSYFLMLHKKALQSSAFKKIFHQTFWSFNKKEIIEKGEINLSKALLKEGLKGGSYTQINRITDNQVAVEERNPTHFYWKELIQKQGYPFIKKELLFKNPEGIEDSLNVFDVIESSSTYNPALIAEEIVSYCEETPKVHSLIKPLVICHIFFPDTAISFIKRLSQLKINKTKFIFNLSFNLANNSWFKKLLRDIFEDCLIIEAPNKGRDIGAKLFMLDIAINTNIQSDITLFIHDKKSIHLENGEQWRDELFAIIDKENLEHIANIFNEKSEIGIICSNKFIQNEYIPSKNQFNSTSNSQIKKTLSKYQIVTNNFNFVAGNIFWIRTNMLEAFFSTRSLAEIRSELEKGNALDFGNGTMIHSWERIMSWIATSQDKTIYGI